MEQAIYKLLANIGHKPKYPLKSFDNTYRSLLIDQKERWPLLTTLARTINMNVEATASVIYHFKDYVYPLYSIDPHDEHNRYALWGLLDKAERGLLYANGGNPSYQGLFAQLPEKKHHEIDLRDRLTHDAVEQIVRIMTESHRISYAEFQAQMVLFLHPDTYYSLLRQRAKEYFVSGPTNILSSHYGTLQIITSTFLDGPAEPSILYYEGDFPPAREVIGHIRPDDSSLFIENNYYKNYYWIVTSNGYEHSKPIFAGTMLHSGKTCVDISATLPPNCRTVYLYRNDNESDSTKASCILTQPTIPGTTQVTLTDKNERLPHTFDAVLLRRDHVAIEQPPHLVYKNTLMADRFSSTDLYAMIHAPTLEHHEHFYRIKNITREKLY